MSSRPPRSRLLALLVTLLCAIAAPASAQQEQQQQQGGLTQLAAAAATPDTAQVRLDASLEAALAIPEGDLAASFASTERGFSAGAGYALGLRLRWFVAPRLALSPSFHFTAFGEHEDYELDGSRFHVATTVAHYGLDVVYQAPGAFADWRPFLGAGLEITQNRYRETFDADATEYQASVTGLSPRVQAGVRRGDFYAALALQWSRFSTPRFFFTDEDTRYNWDTARLVVGYTLPRI